MATSRLAIEATPQAIPTVVNWPQGFQELYQQYSSLVFRTALRVTGNPSDAEDVMQTVFLRVLNLKVDSEGSPERYLRRAATNASIDVIRKRTSQAENQLEEGREYGSKESTLLLKERVRRALAQLDPADAEMFVLCYLEGLSYEELADQFHVERGTVASRLFRIRLKLQKEIER
jgi:RNA polymerase sigma-70 factor (ECF subfamily)